MEFVSVAIVSRSIVRGGAGIVATEELGLPSSATCDDSIVGGSGSLESRSGNDAEIADQPQAVECSGKAVSGFVRGQARLAAKQLPP